MKFEVTVEEKQVIQQFMRAKGVQALLEMVRDVVAEDAFPVTVTPQVNDQRSYGMTCYMAMNGLDSVIEDIEE